MGREQIVTIEAPHYEETRKALAADPVIKQMALELPDDVLPDYVAHEDGSPTYEFMMRATDEYHARGGKIGGHIGACGEAILRVYRQQKGRNGEVE